MDIDYIVKTFLETLKGVPITLIIMIVAMVLSFLPALFISEERRVVKECAP